MAIGEFATRLSRGISRRLVEDWAVHPSIVGWRHLRCLPIEGAGETVSCELDRGPRAAGTLLPLNVSSVEDLPSDRGHWGQSFRDVATRPPSEFRIVRARNVSVLRAFDRWRNEFYLLLAADGRSLGVRGTGLRAEHRPGLKERRASDVAKSGAWILGQWKENYFHWTTEILPRVLALVEAGLGDRTVLPVTHAADGFMAESLQNLSPSVQDSPSFAADRMEFEELFLADSGAPNGTLLRRLARALGGAPSASPSRRIFVSRAGAERRRLRNEGDLVKRLKPIGFEPVQLESLSWREQVGLMGETAILVAPHGAGLANALFLPPAAAVVEILDPAYTVPCFFDLSVSIGLQYRYVLGVAGESRPGEWRDFSVEPLEVERACREALDGLP